jgi:hypothetical protein
VIMECLLPFRAKGSIADDLTDYNNCQSQLS